MGQTGPDGGQFLSKFLLTIIHGAIASGVAVYVLYSVHLSRTPEPADVLTLSTPQSDGLSTEERRELTRQMLKARRENPEIPEQVRPTPSPLPSTTGTADTGAVPVNPAGAKPRAERTGVATAAPPSVPPLPAARPPVARVRTEPAASTVVAAPQVITPPVNASRIASSPLPAPVAPGEASPPGVANANPAPDGQPEPERRGFAANVLSSFSVLVGTAANATGNTVNWVIDLPGKAISAGGKMLGRDSASSNPPPAPAPADPSAAPPPKRNFL
jgi:hypothetical protein